MYVAKFRQKWDRKFTMAQLKVENDNGWTQFIIVETSRLFCPMDILAEKAMRILEVAINNGIVEVDIEGELEGQICVRDLNAKFPMFFFTDPSDETEAYLHAGVSEERREHLCSRGFLPLVGHGVEDD